MTTVLHERSDGAKVLWLHDHPEIEGFLFIADLLCHKYNGTIESKLSVDVDLWEFQFNGVTLSLILDCYGNELVATDPKAFPLLEKIRKDLNSDNFKKL